MTRQISISSEDCVEHSSRASSQVRILVVENSRVPRTFMHDVLREAGYRTRDLDDGKDVSSMFNSFSPQLVLLASSAADEGGLTASSQIRGKAADSRVPVIITLTRDSYKEVSRAFAAGAADWLFMPLERMELLARVENALRVSKPSSSSPTDEGQRASKPLPSGGPQDDAGAEEIAKALREHVHSCVSEEFRLPLESAVRLANSLKDGQTNSGVTEALETLRDFTVATKRLLAAVDGWTNSGEGPVDAGRSRKTRFDTRVAMPGRPHSRPGVVTSGLARKS